jgi:hypothetical protein
MYSFDRPRALYIQTADVIAKTAHSFGQDDDITRNRLCCCARDRFRSLYCSQNFSGGSVSGGQPGLLRGRFARCITTAFSRCKPAPRIKLTADLTSANGKIRERAELDPKCSPYNRGCLKSFTPVESIEHDANGSNVDHGLRRLHRVFIVFAESAIATEPSELRPTIQLRPVILKARCRCLTICRFQPSSRMI